MLELPKKLYKATLEELDRLFLRVEGGKPVFKFGLDTILVVKDSKEEVTLEVIKGDETLLRYGFNELGAHWEAGEEGLSYLEYLDNLSSYVKGDGK